MFGQLKTNYNYEQYLNHSQYSKYITKFRLSDHYLPVERGRYMKPKIPRIDRKCILCRTSIGNEFHALFECTDSKLQELRNNHMAIITKISYQLSKLSNKNKLLYFLSGSDPTIIPTVGKWLCEINQIYKKQPLV